jgi:hypothetical protein
MGYVDAEEARRLVDTCLDAGGDDVRYANLYSQGESERVAMWI